MRGTSLAALLFRTAAVVSAVWPVVVLVRFGVSIVRPQVGLFDIDTALACTLVVVLLVLAGASLLRGVGG